MEDEAVLRAKVLVLPCGVHTEMQSLPLRFHEACFDTGIVDIT